MRVEFMKKRILTDTGFEPFKAPAASKKVENILEEKEEPATKVQKDYTLMTASSLKEALTERKIEFKGNASKETLLALLVNADKEILGTTEDTLGPVPPEDLTDL